MDPRDPKTRTGWSPRSMAAAGASAISRMTSAPRSSPIMCRRPKPNCICSTSPAGPSSGSAMQRKRRHFTSPHFAPDGTIWLLSDIGSDFQRLGTIDPKSGKFTPRGPTLDWDIEDFKMSGDGRSIACSAMKQGSAVSICSTPRSGALRKVDGLPQGVAGDLDIAPWGTIGLTLSSAKHPRRCLFDRSGDARRHPLDDQRDRRPRPGEKRRTRIDRGRQLRR